MPEIRNECVSCVFMWLHMQKAKKKTNDKTAAMLHKSGTASENLKTSDKTITQVKDGK